MRGVAYHANGDWWKFLELAPGGHAPKVLIDESGAGRVRLLLTGQIDTIPEPTAIYRAVEGAIELTS